MLAGLTCTRPDHTIRLRRLGQHARGLRQRGSPTISATRPQDDAEAFRARIEAARPRPRAGRPRDRDAWRAVLRGGAFRGVRRTPAEQSRERDVRALKTNAVIARRLSSRAAACPRGLHVCPRNRRSTSEPGCDFPASGWPSFCNAARRRDAGRAAGRRRQNRGTAFMTITRRQALQMGRGLRRRLRARRPRRFRSGRADQGGRAPLALGHDGDLRDDAERTSCSC